MSKIKSHSLWPQSNCNSVKSYEEEQTTRAVHTGAAPTGFVPHGRVNGILRLFWFPCWKSNRKKSICNARTNPEQYCGLCYKRQAGYIIAQLLPTREFAPVYTNQQKMYLLPEPIAQGNQCCSSSASAGPTCHEPQHVFPGTTCTQNTYTEHPYTTATSPSPCPQIRWRPISGTFRCNYSARPCHPGLRHPACPVAAPGFLLSPAAPCSARPAPVAAEPHTHTPIHTPACPTTPSIRPGTGLKQPSPAQNCPLDPLVSSCFPHRAGDRHTARPPAPWEPGSSCSQIEVQRDYQKKIPTTSQDNLKVPTVKKPTY